MSKAEKRVGVVRVPKNPFDTPSQINYPISHETPVAVTLIIMGALLIMTPAISDYLFQRNVVALMTHTGFTSVNLDGKMRDLSRFGCWLTGTLMIVIAVRRSLHSASEPAKQPALATHTA